MAGTTGLEPATSDVTGRRSNQLSYVPAFTSDNPFNISRRGNNAKRERAIGSRFGIDGKQRCAALAWI